LKKFSDSPRIAILRGLKLEAEGNYEAAARLYRSLLGRPVDDKGKGKVEGGIIWKGEPDETMIVCEGGSSERGASKLIHPPIDRSSTFDHSVLIPFHIASIHLTQP
jgi:hypothetical protein